MVLEDLFKPGAVLKRPYLAFFFGFFFSFVGFFLSWFLFPKMMSVSMVFLTTLLLLPTLISLIDKEERVEARSGLRDFFRNHKSIFEAYFFAFKGIFLAFLILGFLTYKTGLYNQVFSFQLDVLKFQGVNNGLLESFLVSESSYGLAEFFSLLCHNLLVLIICFVLSFFYGASAIFLIILNGSVFANFVVFIIKSAADTLLQGLESFLFFLIHLLPEISGFLMAAIAGGVVSKAIIVEKRGSKHFRNVFKDAFFLMSIAVALIILGALLETFVSSALFRSAF